MAPLFCRVLVQGWPGHVSKVMSLASCRGSSRTQRPFDFQTTLPRPPTEVQNAGVSACPCLSELGWTPVHFPGAQKGLRQKAEPKMYTHGQDTFQLSLSFPSNQRSTCGFKDSPNGFHHFYLFTYLFNWSKLQRNRKLGRKLNFSYCKARMTLQSTQVEIQPTWPTSMVHVEYPSTKICLSIYKKQREVLWAEQRKPASNNVWNEGNLVSPRQ